MDNADEIEILLPPRRGEIRYVLMPGQPHDPHVPRPALVDSEDARNRMTEHAMVIPFFSRAGLGPTRILVRAGVGGLLHDSVLVCEEITTLDHDFFVSNPFGPHVPRELLDRVIQAVRRALGDLVLES